MSKKLYSVLATEVSPVKLTVESDKSPEEFDSLKEFYEYADFIDSKGHDGELTSFHDWDELTWQKELDMR